MFLDQSVKLEMCMVVMTSMSGLSTNRTSRRMDVDVKEMDVRIVVEFIKGEL
jgi:hypothetical protein